MTTAQRVRTREKKANIDRKKTKKKEGEEVWQGGSATLFP